MAAPRNNFVTIGTSQSTVVAANPNRKGLLIFNNGNDIIYLGFDTSVTTSNGMPILPRAAQAQSGLEMGYRGLITAISGSAGQNVRFMEWDQ